MIDHLSYSSISLFQSCPAAWKYKYIDKRPSFSNPALVFGTAIHETVESYIVNGGNLLSIWQEAWQKASTDEERGAIVWGADTPEQHCNEGIRILSNKDIVENLEKIRSLHGGGENCIERKIELRVPHVDVPIIGYIDFIDRNGIPADFKTSSKRWSDDRANKETQPLFYLTALNQAGEPVPGLKFRYFIVVKTKTPQFQTFETVRKPGEMFGLLQNIQKVWESIQANVFPENTSSWKCSPKWCDHYQICQGKYE
jgi:hypothetical protein